MSYSLLDTFNSDFSTISAISDIGSDLLNRSSELSILCKNSQIKCTLQYSANVMAFEPLAKVIAIFKTSLVCAETVSSSLYGQNSPQLTKSPFDAIGRICDLLRTFSNRLPGYKTATFIK